MLAAYSFNTFFLFLLLLRQGKTHATLALLDYVTANDINRNGGEKNTP
jgi:hypothetical protein